MKEILDYLSRLRENNNREWFQAHKEEYDRLRPLFVEKIQELIQQISQFDEDIVGLEAKNCMYRIYRDIRFSPDKTPYKSYMSAYIANGGSKRLRAGYYFHIEPCADSLVWCNMLSAGLYCPEPTVLRSVREEILDNGAAIAAAIGRARGFRLCRTNSLKRVPTGFPADSEWSDMLKLKDFYLVKPVTEEFLLADDLLERTLAEFRRTQPFVAILNRAVQYAYEEMGG